MFYTIYKITNRVNDKIYIGAHKTSDLYDGYMGSGKIIKRAIEKYGMENFEKEILEVFESSDEMYKMESKLVTKDFIKEDTNYNLKEGGFGGFEYINDYGMNIYETHSERARENIFKAKSAQLEKFMKDEKFRDEWIIRCNKQLEEFRMNNDNGFKGKSHSDKTKKKIGEANSKHQKGEGNSQFGTMWIHNLEEKISKKIKKDEFSDWEAKGWLKGRKMKFL